MNTNRQRFYRNRFASTTTVQSMIVIIKVSIKRRTQMRRKMEQKAVTGPFGLCSHQETKWCFLYNRYFEERIHMQHVRSRIYLMCYKNRGRLTLLKQDVSTKGYAWYNLSRMSGEWRLCLFTAEDKGQCEGFHSAIITADQRIWPEWGE